MWARSTSFQILVEKINSLSYNNSHICISNIKIKELKHDIWLYRQLSDDLKLQYMEKSRKLSYDTKACF